jgi:hypothetical protein
LQPWVAFDLPRKQGEPLDIERLDGTHRQHRNRLIERGALGHLVEPTVTRRDVRGQATGGGCEQLLPRGGVVGQVAHEPAFDRERCHADRVHRSRDLIKV